MAAEHAVAGSLRYVAGASSHRMFSGQTAKLLTGCTRAVVVWGRPPVKV